jgi:hypothetical protein
MFRNTLPSPLADADVVEHPAELLVPISVLALDLDVPPVGWDVYLSDRAIEIVPDDLGRRSVSRAAAKELIREKQAAESHAREVMERREAQLIQQDRLRRANMPTGIPAGAVPAGMTGAEAMVLAGEKRRPRSVREQLLEKELSHRGPELVYQSIGPDEG